MKLPSLVFIIGCTSWCTALPSTQTSTRLPTKTKQTTPLNVSTSTASLTMTTEPSTIVERSRTSEITYSTGLSTLTTKNSQSTESTSLPPAKETRDSPGKIRPHIRLNINYTSASESGVRFPEGASAALAKPTKYHYYPHNQHIYLLPECAVQQVCNAVYVRLNFTQPLCACPGRYRDPCSASLDSDDLHTTELITDPRPKALTLVKTCEPVADMRECKTPKDWSLLALQNVRTGKSHYLVICRCPDNNFLEGPMSHDQPTYASVPGIRVYGMMCVQAIRRGRPLRYGRNLLGFEPQEESQPAFPWHRVPELLKTATWD
ncbi:uncharacterized protein Dsx-c73a [Diachasmimorpha longicaudata]|uniref:uncharacterized protein Dsx-c73a n=1 Tax=Diachasmimorpha longicaudata TaxID=58733 RepID=UPI0030B8DFE1